MTCHTGSAHIDVAPEILQTQAAGVLKLFPKRPWGEVKERLQPVPRVTTVHCRRATLRRAPGKAERKQGHLASGEGPSSTATPSGPFPWK